MSESAAAGFWRFSLAFYARPEVASACLMLQDRRGRDVNLLLYACWVGWSGRGRLDAAQLAALDRAIAPWRREVVEPLRAVRRALKTASQPDLLATVKAAELEAERVAQQKLAAMAPPLGEGNGDGIADARASLALYLGDEAAFEGATPLIDALKEMAER